MLTKVCVTCQLEKSIKLFPKNKHRPDGTGRASWCLECVKGLSLENALARERSLDAYYGSEGRAIRQENTRLRKEWIARQKAEKEHIASQEKVCRRCQRLKTMVEFPKNKYNMIEGQYSRSRICLDCYAEMPDGKAELGRERSRDYHRVMHTPDSAKYLMMEESGRHYRDARSKRELIRQLGDITYQVGVDPEDFMAMSREERRKALLPLLGSDE